MNQGVHTVDLLVWFLGEPVEVFAHTGAARARARSRSRTSPSRPSGSSRARSRVLHATTAAYPGLAVRLQVHGDRGSAIIDDDQLEYFASARLGEGDVSASLVAPSQLRRNRRIPTPSCRATCASTPTSSIRCARAARRA